MRLFQKFRTAKSLQSADDIELVRLVAEKNEEAFVILMKRYKDSIASFVYRFLGNYDESLDIAQETFVRLYQHADKFTPDAKFSTWLFTIAANLAKTELRRKRRTNEKAFSTFASSSGNDEYWDVPDETYIPDRRADSTLISERIQIGLMKLKPTFREVLIMREIMEMSYEEIAEISGIEMGTVKSRINRARKQLQEELIDIYNEVFQNP